MFQVWGLNFKGKMKRTMFAGLAFAGTCFFVYFFKYAATTLKHENSVDGIGDFVLNISAHTAA
jgi:hypothetical protein